jgi:hypothetical protein
MLPSRSALAQQVETADANADTSTGEPARGETPLSLPRQVVEVARLSVEQQEDLAEQYRTSFLLKLSPDDWYLCYSEPKLEDFDQPMYQGFYQAMKKAGIDDVRLKPYLKKMAFSQFVQLIAMRTAGQDIPRELFYNCNNHRQKSEAIRRSAGNVLLAGLNRVMGQVLQFVGVDELSYLAGRAVRDRDSEESQSRPKSDTEIETTAREGLSTAKQIVTSFLPAEAATFQVDSPSVKAQKFARAVQILVQQREWPNAYALTMASAGGGPGVGYYALINHYQNANHPDVVAWPSMTDYQKGEAVRRMTADKMRVHIEIAAGRMTPEDYLSTRGVSARLDWNRIIGESFGLDLLRQYHDAAQNNPQLAEQIRGAAYAYKEATETLIATSL